MSFEHGPEVHAVELVAGENEYVANAVFFEEANLFADGVGGALVPVGAIESLLGGEDFDEAVVEEVEVIGLADMSMEADGIELGEDVDAADIAVDTVGDGDIDEAIFATEWDGGFGAIFGEWEKACTFASAEDQTDSVAHGIIRGDVIWWMGIDERRRGDEECRNESRRLHKQCPSELTKSTFVRNAGGVKNFSQMLRIQK